MNYFVLIIIAVAGFILGRWFARRGVAPIASVNKLDNMRTKSQRALSQRTEDRKERILNMMKMDARCSVEGIPRSEVEELIGVSDQTALKYLDELEAEGKVKQVGKGANVRYLLV